MVQYLVYIHGMILSIIMRRKSLIDQRGFVSLEHLSMDVDWDLLEEELVEVEGLLVHVLNCIIIFKIVFLLDLCGIL